VLHQSILIASGSPRSPGFISSDSSWPVPIFNLVDVKRESQTQGSSSTEKFTQSCGGDGCTDSSLPDPPNMPPRTPDYGDDAGSCDSEFIGSSEEYVSSFESSSEGGCIDSSLPPHKPLTKATHQPLPKATHQPLPKATQQSRADDSARLSFLLAKETQSATESKNRPGRPPLQGPQRVARTNNAPMFTDAFITKESHRSPKKSLKN
jgi:hypothetical protein